MDTIDEIKKEIESLPKGTITHKNISGKTRTYLQWREDGKYKSYYLRDSEVPKYNELVERRKMLEKKLKELENTKIDLSSFKFNLNVITDIKLENMCKVVLPYDKRDCFKRIMDFFENDYSGKVLILYGLRRTGKTTLLFQTINELKYDKCAYIKVNSDNNMSQLTKDLDSLYKLGYKYIFIDEITLLDDFINTAAVLSDIYSMLGMKIVLSGTDSLGFVFADKNELYDRNIMIHTSYIPYKEYSRLLKIDSIDSYIEYGGTLKKENMSFNDLDYKNDEVSFKDDESTRKYIDSSISRNIQHSLKNDNFGQGFKGLKVLYDNDELTNVINRIIENMNHDFLIKVIKDKFKSHDLGSTKQLLLHKNNDISHVLYDIDTDNVIQKLKELIEIKEKEEIIIEINNTHLSEIKEYLALLDLIKDVRIEYSDGYYEYYVIFTQPGMRYSIAKALVYSLLQDSYFNSISIYNKNLIINKILEDVKGRMLEDIVLLETVMKINKRDVFKYRFDNGEYDMVLYDMNADSFSIYEIKHSDKIDYNQTRHLVNDDVINKLSIKYGKFSKRIVLYRGKTTEIDGILYKNVEEYLKEI